MSVAMRTAFLRCASLSRASTFVIRHLRTPPPSQSGAAGFVGRTDIHLTGVIVP